MFEAATTAPIWPTALTALGGVLVGLAAPWVTATLTVKRERESRTEARLEARRDRLNDLQRETLLALQNACQNLMNMEQEIHSWNMENFREHGRAYVTAPPAEANAGSQDAYRQTTILGVRVKDNEVRKLLQQLKDRCVGANLFPENPARAATEIREAGRVFVLLNERIGLVLRSLYDSDSL